MDCISVPEEALRPRLLSARQFDSRRQFEAGRVRTSERITENYEFSFYYSEGGALVIDGQKYLIHPGLWRFQPPGTRIYSILPFACSTVHFTLDGAAAPPTSALQNDFLSLLPPCFESRMPQRYGAVLDALIRAGFEVGTGAAVKKTAALYSLLELMYEDVTTPEQNSVIRRAEDYLKAHFSEPLSLELLGDLAGYHPLYFQRIFKAKTGKSPHEYLLNLRMTHARRLLLTTKLSVRAVAVSCGFPSISHFNAVFKKQNGVSPMVFRRQNTLPA